MEIKQEKPTRMAFSSAAIIPLALWQVPIGFWVSLRIKDKNLKGKTIPAL